ncbi:MULTISPECIES: hypothetical protein [Nocardiopsis]|nr:MULTISPECIES: hypothetical protein [Nocardiopsis]
MAEHKNEQVNTGIINRGGKNTMTNCAQGTGATVVNGQVVKGTKVDSKKK